MAYFSNYKRLADEFYSGRTFVAFDTETTGLKASDDYVIELGAVKFNCEGLIGEPFNVLIKPPVSIPPFITELTHISDFMVKDAPSMKDVIPDFLKYVCTKQTCLVAHNAPFDVKFMNSELVRAGYPELTNLTFDTLKLARWAYPELATMGETGPYKLQNLASRFKIDVKSAHRASDDARVCMELFKKIVLSVQ